jgi:IS1 family transposase
MSWQVVTERTVETMQPIIDDAPAAFQYCSDGFSTSDALNYPPGLHLVAEGKTQTYSVEGGNADLRHSLVGIPHVSAVAVDIGTPVFPTRQKPGFQRLFLAVM